MNDIKETEEVEDLIYKLRSEELSYPKMSHEKRMLIFKYCKTVNDLKNNIDDSFHFNLLGLLYSDIDNDVNTSNLYYSKAVKMGDEFAKYNMWNKTNNTWENINGLKKLNSKLLTVKLALGIYLMEANQYLDAIKVLSEIVNEKFCNYHFVMWNLHVCYKKLDNIDLSFFYFKKCLPKFLSDSDDKELNKSILYFPELQIVNKDSTKCVVKITHYLGSILNVNLIELIVDYFE